VIDSATEEAIMTKRAVCCFALLTALSFTSGQAQQNPPVKTKAPDTAASAHAAGSSVWQDIFGITREQFHTLGYDTLSQEQGKAIGFWFMTNRPILTCGKSYDSEDKEGPKYVHPFIEAANTDATAFVGELRSRIAATRDVRLVYSDTDADLIVSVLAMSTTIGGRQSGYVAAVTVLTPCIYSVPSGMGAGTSRFRRFTDGFVDTGPDAASVLSQVASTLDVSDFDPVRAEHSSMLK
jgi:hypothetical protein